MEQDGVGRAGEAEPTASAALFETLAMAMV
jgi:hypothetical protein